MNKTQKIKLINQIRKALRDLRTESIPVCANPNFNDCNHNIGVLTARKKGMKSCDAISYWELWDFVFEDLKEIQVDITADD